MEKFSKWLTPIVALFFALALGVTAATTIGTDIETTGSITATDATFVGDMMVNPGDDPTIELTVETDLVTLDTAVLNVPRSEPYACTAPVKGTVYFDSTDNELCFCNGTAWKQVAQTSTECNPDPE